MFRLHTESPIPKVHSYLFPMIERCLEKEPSQRYQSFHELLSDLEILLKRKAGKVVCATRAERTERTGVEQQRDEPV